MAERVGFEPTVGFPTHAFQACALSHSAISPLGLHALPIAGVEDRRGENPVAVFQRVENLAEREGFEPSIGFPIHP